MFEGWKEGKVEMYAQFDQVYQFTHLASESAAHAVATRICSSYV